MSLKKPINMNNQQIKSLAPIIVFAYIRKDSLERVITSLKNNYLAKFSDIYIYIDGPRNKKEELLSTKVIEYCKSIDGFNSKTININKVNKGLDPSIIDGVTKVINKHGKSIILEDDVVVTPNFLNYMNQVLDFYETDNRIMSVSGFGLNVKKPTDYIDDVYMFGRSTSWGWATWKDRWNAIDWNISDWNEFSKNKKAIREFKKRGGSDMYVMLKKCLSGGGMWDIRFCYHMFKANTYSIVPFKSLTENIGFNDLATHCKTVTYNRFKYILDDGEKTSFLMSKDIEPNSIIISSRLKYQSIKLRIYSKIRNILHI